MFIPLQRAGINNTTTATASSALVKHTDDQGNDQADGETTNQAIRLVIQHSQQREYSKSNNNNDQMKRFYPKNN